MLIILDSEKSSGFRVKDFEAAGSFNNFSSVIRNMGELSCLRIESGVGV